MVSATFIRSAGLLVTNSRLPSFPVLLTVILVPGSSTDGHTKPTGGKGSMIAAATVVAPHWTPLLLPSRHSHTRSELSLQQSNLYGRRLQISSFAILVHPAAMQRFNRVRVCRPLVEIP